MTMYIVQWMSEIPLITKGFFYIYIITATLNGLFPSLVKYRYFLFKLKSISTYLTTFFYFGKRCSIYSVYELILFVSYSKALENHYISSNSRKSYLFCLFCGSLIILFLSTFKSFKPNYLSRALVFYIIYLYNNHKNPNGRTIFLPALVIDNKYMTVVLIFVSTVFHMFRWSEYFIGIIAAYLFVNLQRIPIFRNYF